MTRARYATKHNWPLLVAVRSIIADRYCDWYTELSRLIPQDGNLRCTKITTWFVIVVAWVPASDVHWKWLRSELAVDHWMILERKGKEAYLYSAVYILCIPQSAQAWITVLPADTPCLPFLHKRSPDSATPNWGKRHLIAAYYSSIDPEGMKGWVGLVGWPTADGLPI